MNSSPNGTGANVREELARLVPAPVERDLPGDRHHHLQEFVMTEIQRDARTTRPRRSVRRPVLVTAALTAAAAIAAVVGVAATGGTGDNPVTPPGETTAALSGPDILLAAATTAQRQPDGTGNYWYVKVETTGGTWWEDWYGRDGRYWLRAAKLGDRPVLRPEITGFMVGARNVSLQQVLDLPSTPDALTAWVTTAVENADIRNSGGPLDAAGKARYVLYGLVSLVTQVPAPPKVRAAAFEAIAAYPNVTNLGPVDGGTGLRITLFDDLRVRLVLDRETTRVRQSTFIITADGALYGAGEGGSITLTTGWTDTLP